MTYIIRKLENNELDEAFTLIWHSFSEFVAPDYTLEAVENFKTNFVESEDFKDEFRLGKQRMYGAFIEDRLVGMISIKENGFLSCCFVDKAYHRSGIATQLFNSILPELKERKISAIRLNTSPYAVHFYHKLGFEDLDSQQEFKGILYTPMEYVFR